MFKSIFSKHFTVMSLVIVVSFVAMGGMQMLFSTRYWVSEKRALLTENARNVAEFTVSNAVQNPADPTSYILSGGTEPILRMLSTAVDGTAVVVDNDYKVVASSVRSLVGQTLHESVRDKITGAKGSIFRSTTLADCTRPASTPSVFPWRAGMSGSDMCSCPPRHRA